MNPARAVCFALCATFIFFWVPHHMVLAKENSESPLLSQTATNRFNNQNWQIVHQPVVASFTTHADGSSFGTTTDGIPFRQYPLTNRDGINVQRFEIQDHYHFIVEGEIAYSLEVLSRLLAHRGQTDSALSQ